VCKEFSLITGKQLISPGNSNKIQNFPEIVGKSWNNPILSAKLQRTPIVNRFS
jgi:hypothetical protein